VWNWSWGESHSGCRAFLGRHAYYRIWIPGYAIVTHPLFQILWKDVEFQWAAEEKNACAILKEALCNFHQLKTLDICNGAGQIVVGVDARLEGWGALLKQDDRNNDWHPCHYESRLWNMAKKRYHSGKHQCGGLLQALEKFGNYQYGVRCVVETDTNTSVHQLNLPANDLQGALATCWIAYI